MPTGVHRIAPERAGSRPATSVPARYEAVCPAPGHSPPARPSALAIVSVSSPLVVDHDAVWRRPRAVRAGRASTGRATSAGSAATRPPRSSTPPLSRLGAALAALAGAAGARVTLVTALSADGDGTPAGRPTGRRWHRRGRRAEAGQAPPAVGGQPLARVDRGWDPVVPPGPWSAEAGGRVGRPGRAGAAGRRPVDEPAHRQRGRGPRLTSTTGPGVSSGGVWVGARGSYFEEARHEPVDR